MTGSADQFKWKWLQFRFIGNFMKFNIGDV